MKAGRLILPLFAVTILLLGIYLGLRVVASGEFRKLDYHSPASCRALLGVMSSEDIAIDRELGRIYISSADRRRFDIQEPVQGEIAFYDLATDHLAPTRATGELPFEFQPHGLSFWAGEDGSKRLFVVNHRNEADTIEIFSVRGDQLEHIESIASPDLYNANDIASVGERRFYVTIDHGFRSGWARQIEELLGLRQGKVLYFDSEQFRPVAGGLAYPNGIALGQDGQTLLVAATIDQTLSIYEIEQGSGSLTKSTSLELGTGPDNLDVDEEGAVWIGAHPKLLTFTNYASDADRLSPSQVLKVSSGDTGEYSIDEILLTNGEYLSGSSVAVQWKNQVIIGSVFDRRLLICELD